MPFLSFRPPDISPDLRLALENDGFIASIRRHESVVPFPGGTRSQPFADMELVQVDIDIDTDKWTDK